MAISLSCKCGKRFKVPEELIGKRIKCPVCQSAISVQPPEPTPSPADNDGPQELQFASTRAFAAPRPKPPAPKAAKGSSARTKALTPCSRCNQPFPPEQLVKLRGQNICRPCKEAVLIERPSSVENARKVLIYSMIFSAVGLVIVAGLGVFLLIRLASKPPAKKPPPKIESEPVMVADAGKLPGGEAKSEQTAATDAPAPSQPAPKTQPQTTPPAAPKNEADPSWRPLRHDPQPGTRWRFQIEAALGLANAADAEANRLTGIIDVEQHNRAPSTQDLSLRFRKLEVAGPFTDDDYRGAGAFPGNVLNKQMTLRLGRKSEEQVPRGVPLELPGILEDGDPIVHEDESRDPAGKAFKKYLTRQGNDLLAQAFLVLGRDLLPKDLGNPKTWQVAQPLYFDAGIYAPVTWTLERQPASMEHLAKIAVKTKADHTHKQDAGPTYKLKIAGTGSWLYNLDDSMTEEFDYTATIEEEQLPDMVRNRYVVRIRVHRLPPTEEPEPPPPQPTPPPSAPTPMPEPANQTNPEPEPKLKAQENQPPAEPKPQPTTEQQEKLAQSRLKQARQLVEFGKTEDAIEYCEDILKRWPKTRAAQEAADLLKKLKR